MAKLTPQMLDELKQRGNKSNNWIKVGMSSCGIAAGAEPVYEALVKGVKEQGLEVEVRKCGCMGSCCFEPLVEVNVEGAPRTLYGNVDADVAQWIIDAHIGRKRVVEKYVVPGFAELTCSDEELLKSAEGNTKQYRIVMRNCGVIDPDNIDEFIAEGGYQGLKRALQMKPEDVIGEISKSGIRGRGGAGFPTGLKWKLTREVKAKEHFIICNGDEGDPGAYMDRSVLESDPHAVIEGMIIGGYAVGAAHGYFYIRAEYPLAVARIEKAIRQARASGLLGKDILGTGFDFDLDVRLGAGAFVCGEETALISSLEGKRGTPHPRPPYPSVKGLWNSPTCINNVETLANIGQIMDRGADWFAKIGVGKSTGTKVFAITGKVQRSGLIEVPMGMKLSNIVHQIGGGSASGKAVKAVQTGGPSGGVIPKDLFDTPVSYEHLTTLGSIMGSGGMIVMEEGDSMVDIAKFYLGFCVEESCGKCAPCRIGGKQMLLILEKLTAGKGEAADLVKLQRLALAMKKASLCGLGQTAANPVLSTLKYFNQEYMKCIEQGEGLAAN
ncbi:MAG: SLBB domain-containing protein [Deltaproteobacteria bacterium]|nr:SLBB domain-containing protein [Deltaproteobacteria bacterium]